MVRVYADLDDTFVVRLKNAAPDLLTFIRYPGMESTDNESERTLHNVMMHRKVCQNLATNGEVIMLGTVITYLLTWDNLEPN